jgi:hypothetical protein
MCKECNGCLWQQSYGGCELMGMEATERITRCPWPKKRRKAKKVYRSTMVLKMARQL